MGDATVRLDAVEKVTGDARFTSDLAAATGGLVAVIVRSDRGSGRLVGVDHHEALAVPGVVAVLTGADCDPIRHRTGSALNDHPILAVDLVRYYGEPVALVVAESVRAAVEGASAVWLDIDETPALTDVEEALRDGAPSVHPSLPDYRRGLYGQPGVKAGPGNVFHQDELSWGDVAAARSEAAVVVETIAHYPRVFPLALESHVAAAEWRDGTLEVVSSSQHPFSVRAELAAMFDLPLACVQLRTGYLGGGYGSKTWTKLEPLACLAALKLHRAVQVVTDLGDSFFTVRADSGVIRVTSGFTATGEIVFRDFDIVLDSGAYAEQSPRVLDKTVSRCFGPYRVPNLRVRGRAVYTNTVPASSYRGFGAPQGALAGETNLDAAARRLGLSGSEIRRRNLVARGERLHPRLRGMDADLKANLALVEEMIANGDAQSAPIEGGRRRRYGIGFACTASDAGAIPGANVIVRVHDDGSLTLLTGASEMGQGSKTALAVVASRMLGIPIGRISVVQGNTAMTPFERSTNASRTTSVVGLAVQRACDSIVDQLLGIASTMTGRDRSRLAYANGAISDVGGGGEPVATLASLIQSHVGVNGGELIGVGQVYREGRFEELPPFWELGMIGVRVAVDLDTGEVEVLHIASVADVGAVIFRPGVEGQEHGAMTQGFGVAMTEELWYDGQQPGNADIVGYRVPRASDLPARIEAAIVERRDGPGPFGAKGIGEGALNPVPAAVFNAVCDAIGRWPTEVVVPLTPDRVLTMLAAAESGDGPR